MSLSSKCCKKTKAGILIFALVKPNSLKTEVSGLLENRLVINVKSSPVKGAANKDCLKLISSFTRIPLSSVSLKSGATSRFKTFLLSNIAFEKVCSIMDLRLV